MDDKNLTAIIQPKFFTFECNSDLIFINSPARNYDEKSIDLFGINRTKLHRLFCTINNSRAYIDNSWFRLGDGIDNHRLMNIGPNSIEIQEERNGKTTLVELGASW